MRIEGLKRVRVINRYDVEAVSYTHLDVYKRQGMTLVVAGDQAAQALRLLNDMGERAYLLGEIQAGEEPGALV